MINIFKIKRPRVSVVIPIYNTEEGQLRECIESTLAQTFRDFELIILNDSPDNRVLDAIVKSYNDRRIRYYRNRRNLGISGARNRLLRLARGEYIAVHDHDDVSMPNRLQAQVDYMDENPNVGLCSANVLINGENPTNYETENVPIKYAILHWCAIPHSVAMLRKSVLDKYNIRYEVEYSPAEDHRLFARLMEYTQFHILPDVLMDYRSHDRNTTRLRFKQITDASNEICNQLMNRFPYSALEPVVSQELAEIREMIISMHRDMDILRAELLDTKK